MNQLPGSSRTSAAKAGWVVGLLLVGWLGFVLVPLPPEKKGTRAVTNAQVDSKLRTVGLTDNVDWDGLPDYFAVWAPQAHWHNDKAKFAYWHAGSRSYAYFFEVTRNQGTYRFRSITEKEALGSHQDHSFVKDHLHPSMTSDPGEQEEARYRDYPNHPFVFLPLLASTGIYPGRSPMELPEKEKPPGKSSVAIDLRADPLQVPSGVDLIKPDEQSKK
jgi:hypothetical protein